MCTDNFTKWPEAKELSFSNENVLVSFLFEDICTCFCVPREIVIDQGTHFTSKMVQNIMEEYKIKNRKSTPYHPHEIGQVESTNKVIEAILTKIVHLHRTDLIENLLEDLWDYRTTWRNTTRNSPYEIVYGKQVLFPIEFQIRTLKTAVKLGHDFSKAQKHRMEKLNEFDEIRQDSVQNTSLFQQQRSSGMINI